MGKAWLISSGRQDILNVIYRQRLWKEIWVCITDPYEGLLSKPKVLKVRTGSHVSCTLADMCKLVVQVLSQNINRKRVGVVSGPNLQSSCFVQGTCFCSGIFPEQIVFRILVDREFKWLCNLYNLCPSNYITFYNTGSEQCNLENSIWTSQNGGSHCFNCCHIHSTVHWCTMPSDVYLFLFGPTWLEFLKFWLCVVLLESLRAMPSGWFSRPPLPFWAFLPIVSRDFCNICHEIGETKTPGQQVSVEQHALYMLHP